jgi:hypothetical protein
MSDISLNNLNLSERAYAESNAATGAHARMMEIQRLRDLQSMQPERLPRPECCQITT